MNRKSKSKIIRRQKDVPKKRQKNADDRRTWKQWLFILAVILFIGGVFYIFICSTFVEVNKFDVQGANRVDEDEILDIINDVVSGNFIACLKKNNYFFIDKERIREQILQDKRIKDVIVQKEFPNTIHTSITEYGTVAVWCLGGIQGNCFVLEDGIAVSAVKLNDDVVVQNKHFVIVDEVREEINIEDRIIASELLNKIEKLGEELIYVLNIVIEQPYIIESQGSHEIRFVTDEGWHVVVDLKQNADEILDIAKLFNKKVELPSHRSDLEYIDMRFPEKIFYKMKEGVEQVEEVDDENTDIDDSTNNEDESDVVDKN